MYDLIITHIASVNNPAVLFKLGETEISLPFIFQQEGGKKTWLKTGDERQEIISSEKLALLIRQGLFQPILGLQPILKNPYCWLTIRNNGIISVTDGQNTNVTHIII